MDETDNSLFLSDVHVDSHNEPVINKDYAGMFCLIRVLFRFITTLMFTFEQNKILTLFSLKGISTTSAHWPLFFYLKSHMFT